MAYRVLIDENIDPSTAEDLSDRGHKAVTFAHALEKGSTIWRSGRKRRHTDISS